jgi:hypothetical protein
VKVIEHKVMRKKVVVARRKWAKFGDSRGAVGPEPGCTIVSFDEVQIERKSKSTDEEESIVEKWDKIWITYATPCKHCGRVGDHNSLKCPYRKNEVEAST